MVKRWITLSVMVMLLFALASCSRGDNETAHVVVNNPVKVVYEHDEGDDITLADTGLSYWVQQSRQYRQLLKTMRAVCRTDVTTDENGVRTHVRSRRFRSRFPGLRQTGNDRSGILTTSSWWLFGIRRLERALSHGSSFEPAHRRDHVKRDGSVETKAEKNSRNFDDGGFDPLDGDEFVEEVTYNGNVFTMKRFEETFDVYVAGANVRFTLDAANFFDWILVIPVAFIMSFFAGLMGNSFCWVFSSRH